MPRSLIVICHVHFILCGRNSFFSFILCHLFRDSVVFNSSSFVFIVSFQQMHCLFWRSLSRAVLVLLKLLNSFISCRHFSLFLFLFFFLCLFQSSFLSFSLVLRPFGSFFLHWIILREVTYFIRLLPVFFALPLLSVLRSLASYYCLRCNFRLFAVRLYFFIFHINIIDGCFIFNVTFFLLLRSFPFRIHLTKCLLCPPSNQFILLLLQNKAMYYCCCWLFFHYSFPLYTIDGSL